jgi:hypothetical protein
MSSTCEAHPVNRGDGPRNCPMQWTWESCARSRMPSSCAAQARYSTGFWHFLQFDDAYFGTVKEYLGGQVTAAVPHQPTVFGGPSHSCPSTCQRQRQRQPRASRTSMTDRSSLPSRSVTSYYLSEHHADAAPAALDGRRQGGGGRVGGSEAWKNCSFACSLTAHESRFPNWHGSRSPGVRSTGTCPTPRQLHHSATLPAPLEAPGSRLDALTLAQLGPKGSSASASAP